MQTAGRRSRVGLLAAVIWSGAAGYCGAAGAATELASLSETIVAVVDGTEIDVQEFDATFALAARQKYYHRQPPEEKIAQFKREVADSLVNRVLLLREADRRNVEPEAEKIAAILASYEERYKDSPQWQQARAQLLPALQARLEQQSRLEQLEKSVRDAGIPAEAELRAFYASQPKLFTEPDRVRLALILLKVDPSSARAVWDKARDEAASIRARIAKGADFGALAQLHSADASAGQGGDMGYQHRGTLPEAVQEELDKLELGVVSEPLTVLEGVALMKVLDRSPAMLIDFEKMRGRATELWRRAESERRWAQFVADLRARATIRVNQSRFPDYLTAVAPAAEK